jgi:hypothetical protein
MEFKFSGRNFSMPEFLYLKLKFCEDCWVKHRMTDALDRYVKDAAVVSKYGKIVVNIFFFKSIYTED